MHEIYQGQMISYEPWGNPPKFMFGVQFKVYEEINSGWDRSKYGFTDLVLEGTIKRDGRTEFMTNCDWDDVGLCHLLERCYAIACEVIPNFEG